MPAGSVNVFVIRQHGVIEIIAKKKRYLPHDFGDRYAFIENWNLQKTPTHCRGMLAVVNLNGILRLCVIVTLDCQSCVCLALVLKTGNVGALAGDWQSDYNLAVFDATVTYARTVQQINGNRLVLAKASTFPYPFLGSDGCVSTAPVYCDIVVTPPRRSLPDFDVRSSSSMQYVIRKTFSTAERKRAKAWTEGAAFTIFVDESDDLIEEVGDEAVVGLFSRVMSSSML